MKPIPLRALAFCIIVTLSGSLPGRAARATESPPATPEAATEAPDADVEAVRTRYWARGQEAEMGVVQNRTFSKGNRIELGLFSGALSTDPFLAVTTLGVRAGYHFNEFFSLTGIFWRDFVSPSTALETFQDTLDATTNYNAPSGYAGLEGTASLAYGKLSLLGRKIIYYDMHISAGLGATETESGICLTPHLGVGQQVFLNHSIALRVDYRAQHYRETIIERVITPKLGDTVGTRNNWSHSVQIGFSYYFGGEK